MKVSLRAVHDRMLESLGPQNWWPGETPFEIAVGAILTQNTSWTNVAKAIARIKGADLLDPHALYELDEEELAELIRSAGYFRVKARRLRSFLAVLCDKYNGSLDGLFAQGLAAAREELLSINGIGPETADSILLYAGGLPTFVVDAYTLRILARHGWIEPEADYTTTKEFFESALASDAPLFNEYHALIVQVGKHFCHKRAPDCEPCPLRELLPKGGPIGPESW